MSRSPQDIFDHVAELTELYLLNEISDDQLAELEALVRSDEQAAEVMRTVLKQAGMMRVVFNEQRTFANRIGEVDRDEYLSLLQTLQPSEEPELVHVVGQIKPTQPLWQQWPAIMAAVAAVAILALTIALVFQNPGTAPNTTAPNIAATPNAPGLTNPTVATLTATHNATWSKTTAERASARGSHLTTGTKLHPNTRLTLTAGFAEITTDEGAVAILEAPATIELLDNSNALHLHTGKLLGICRTDRSKGFTVHTRHADIVDLGTEFGVEVAGNKVTATVMTGEVEMRLPGGEPQLLVANQTARLSVEGNSRQ
ncbi:MAG: FecR domain-containing protein, partial [Phycisphaeraceae bacterium]